MGKTRDLFKKIGDIKRTFPAGISTIKDRNCKDLTKAEKIKKRWRCQEYTEELYKKGLNDLDNHNSVVTHLEPDILECKVKCNLGSISLNKIQFSSVTQSRLTLCNPWTAAYQASLSIANSQSLLKLTSFESVMQSNHLMLCRPLLLLPSIPPSIRVFSNESALCIRWPKY